MLSSTRPPKVAAILGSGFGLYGYGVALRQLGFQLLLPSRYRERLDSDPILAARLGAAEYVDSENALLASSVSVLVIARHPLGQADVLGRLSSVKADHVFLEKPLLLPGDVNAVDDFLGGAGWTVGYLFPFLDWYRKVEGALMDGTAVAIDWRIATGRRGVERRFGSVPRRAWKDDPSVGGGLLSFYAVHFVPLLSKFGPWDAWVQVNNRNELEMQLRFAHSNSRLSVTIGQTQTAPSFAVTINDPVAKGGVVGACFLAESPFGVMAATSEEDERVPVLREYVASSLNCERHQTRLQSAKLQLEEQRFRLLGAGACSSHVGGQQTRAQESSALPSTKVGDGK